MGRSIISLGSFDEFGPGMGLPSMRGYLSATPYEGQAEIVRYLDTKGEVHMSGGIAYDVLAGERIRLGPHCYKTDGEFGWWDSLPYYIETYNLRFPPEIEARLLEKIRAERGVSQPTADTPSN